jgi:hypothetical protein
VIRIKAWLAETHGTSFELVRHFVNTFFDSDLVTEPGQWTKVMVTAFALIAPSFFMMSQVLAQKYRYFSSRSTALPYQHAVQADQLWLITLTMSVTGLLTAAQWQSLFPGRRDYLALGTLPIRAWQIFFSKFAALMVLITAVIFTLEAMPSLLFPIVSMGRWATNPSLLVHIAVHTFTCTLGCYFIFFSLLAIQGVLLNLFRPAWFARVTNYLQGAAITAMLSGIVMSFSIGPANGHQLIHGEAAKWLPPVWLLGLYQWLLGDSDPYFAQLAERASIGLAIAVVTAAATYLISYRRHRQLAMEGLPAAAAPGRMGGRVLDLLIPDPRQQAVMVFMTKTMARSGQHRIVMVGYFGFAFAVVLTGVAGMVAVTKPNQLVLTSFAYAHLVMLLFLIAGLRHVFAIPSELRANWTFQVLERQGRSEWLSAVDGLATVPAILLILVLPAPFEIAMLGWPGLRESILFAAGYLLLYESMFYGWQKLPFTCSYVPGQKNGFFVVLRFFAVLAVLPAISGVFVAIVSRPGVYAFMLTVLLAAWYSVRRSRRDTWSYTPLRFIEEVEPEVRSLNLGTA